MTTEDCSVAGPPDPADDTLQRLAFLATAGEALASSLDLDRTLEEVARLAVPVLGDLCIVDLVENGQLRRVATVHGNPAKAVWLEKLRRDYPPSPDSPQPAGRVLVTGQLELLEHITPDVIAAHTRDEEHARLIREIGIRSHLALPLVARNVTMGVISLGVSESARTYGPQDVALAQDLARHAALAIDNARLYELAQVELAERARVEEALRVSEGRFRALFEQSPLSTQLLAPDGTTLRVNGAWEKLWGFTLEQIRGYNLLADPQLEAQGTAPLLRRAFEGEAVHLPAIRYDPNETIPAGSRYADAARWVGAFAYPVKDATGSVREVVLVHEDVTDVRRREEELRASEERLRLALAASRMNVWDWDLATDIVRCSDNAREFWGIDVGKAEDFMAVVHPEDVQLLQQASQLAIAGQEPYFSEYRVVGPRQGTRWVQSRGRVDRAPDGRAVRILGVTVDVTELKHAEEKTRLLADAGAALGASLDYQTTLAELSRLLVPRFSDWCAVDLLVDGETLQRVAVHHRDPSRVALASEIFARFPPRPDDDHGSWHVIKTREPEWAAEITDAMVEAGADGPEHLAMLRGLSLQSFICVPLIARDVAIGALTVVYAESGRRYVPSDVPLCADLAGRAAAAVDNARLYERSRVEDRRKDEFLATLAHELRNPLAPIRTGLALFRATADQATLERTRDIMERQLGHMVRLIDDLLDLSRVTRGAVHLNLERLDLWSVVGHALEASRPLLDAAGVQLVVRLPEEPIILEADRTRMSQIFSNILNNAAKFTDRGGRVELVAVEEGSEVLISVTDTGTGIPREMLSQIFEMFVQVRGTPMAGQTGLGIGLTLVQRLVQLHGGRVWAESLGPGRGSTFCVRLPRAAPAGVAQEPSLPAPLPGAAPPRRVLVVDDNVDAAEMLAALVALDGHEVRTASSGAGALEILRDFRPHVAFLDIGLPDMSGYELAMQLRRDPELRGLLLVAVTGWGQAEDRRKSKGAGFDDHLTKPVDPSRVLAIVVGS